ncbi:MAG: histone deacetylase [Bacteroidota bacterium]
MPKPLPIIYAPGYNITLWGLQRLHPFDSEKYRKVFEFLRENDILNGQNHIVPSPISPESLKTVHGEAYLRLLKRSRIVAGIAEVPPLRWVPNFLLQRRLLQPMRLATGGTVLGVQLAARHGWAINLSGGYHHAKRTSSSGFCFFADISLAAYHHLVQHPKHKILIVDLDAHQGNGFADIHGDDPRLPAFDLYNAQIYPQDLPAREFIKYNYPVPLGTRDLPYLKLLQKELPKAITAERPDLIIYNAGSDIYENDPLGQLKVSAAGIVVRDETVFQLARHHKIPILKVLSGGYTPESANIIGSSIRNLWRKGLIGPVKN